MNTGKVLISLILLGMPLFILSAGNIDGADFTQQRESAIRTAQEPRSAAARLQEETNQPRLTSRVLKSKSAADAIEAGSTVEKREKYKPYIAGEGEKKVK